MNMNDLIANLLFGRSFFREGQREIIDIEYEDLTPPEEETPKIIYIDLTEEDLLS